MAISDDWTIDYVNLRVYHSAGTTIYTVNQLYTYFTVVFDNDIQMDDLPPMSAQTPTAFTMENGWFIDPLSIQYLKGGSVNTSGWDAQTHNNGIRVLRFDTYSDCDAGDIGRVVSGGTSNDTGTLLYYDNTSKKWWVRVSLPADTFQIGDVMTITGGSAGSRVVSATDTGENTWTSIFTLGTIAANTQIYLYQNGTRITPWWDLGHIDILILTKEADTNIDSGRLTIIARQYSKLYDHYIADLSDGARTPIPLATFNDAANTTGYRTVTGSAGSGTFQVREIIQKSGDATVQGIVTRVEGTTLLPVLTYYLFKFPLSDFAENDTITGLTSTATCTAGAPADAGPASLAGITITFGANTQNLGNGNGLRPYDVIIDCNAAPLASVYEYLKYLTRYGSQTILNGVPGEYYTGVGDIRLPYSNQTNNFSENTTVNGAVSGASGVIVADHNEGTSGTLVLGSVQGTFQAGERIRVGVTESADAGTAVAVNASKQAPFGTYAGGKFFGAQGVWLANVPGYDVNNYELIDSTGEAQVPPTTVSITVTNTQPGDQVSIFKTTGDNELIDRSMFTSHATNNTATATTFTVQQQIPADTPQSGSIRVVKRDEAGTILGEDRYTYQSWFGNTFNLTTSEQLGQTYDGNDTAYVPYVDITASSTTVTKLITFVSNRYILARVRQKGIIPFNNKGEITSLGLTVATIRTEDVIFTHS